MTWTFIVPRALPSMNARIHNAGPTRWKYARERDEWLQWFQVARTTERIPAAVGPRRLLVERLYAGREQERDFINLVGGCKAPVDALVLAGLLVDDKPSMLVDSYVQARAGKGEGGRARFTLEDMP